MGRMGWFKVRIRAALLLPGLVLASCGSVAEPTAKSLTFAQMQALNPGVVGEWILSEYPHARDINRRSDGSLASMGYWVEDPQGAMRPLMLHFDAQGILTRKQYGGPLVRPPDREETGFQFGG